MTIDITGIDKVKLLQALYNRAKPLGLGFLHFTPQPLTNEEALKLIVEYRGNFDYLNGRVMKVNLSGDTMSGQLFDRDNGEGEAQKAVAEARL